MAVHRPSFHTSPEGRALETPTVQLRPVAMALMLLLAFPACRDQSAPDGGAVSSAASAEWSGRVEIESRSWLFNLRRADGAFHLRIPSMWRPEAPLPSETADGDLRFAFPDELGQVEVGLSGAGSPRVGTIRGGRWGEGAVTLHAVNRPPLQHTDVQLEGDGVVIGATITRQQTSDRRPAVVVLHGGGDSSRADSPGYRFWGEHLAALGLVAVTYDKRGNGESTGSWRSVGFEQRAGDVGRIVDWLRGQPEVDPERVGLVAVSQGTWVASLVGVSDPRLAFIVQIAGPAVSPLEADTFALVHRWRHAGLTAGELTAAGRLWTLEVAAVRSPPGSPAWTRYRDAVARAVRTSWYPKSRYSPSEPTGWFAGWYPLVAGHQPGAAISATMAPSLWIYGAADSESDVERNLQVLRSLRGAARAPIEMACFPNAGHGLNVPVESADGAMPATVAPGFFGLVDGWLTRRAGLPEADNWGFASDDGSASVGCPGVTAVAPR